jgi:uncharacterized protein (TIGR00369 family)
MSQDVDDQLEEYFESMPFLETLGIEDATIEDGTAALTVPYDDRLSNHTVLHGGVAATLIDASVAAATHSAAEATLEDMEPLTVENSAHYLAPIREGSVTATAEMVDVGRRIAFGRSDVHNGGELVATGSTTYYQRWK